MKVNINKNKVREMFNNDISPEKMATELNCSVSGIRYSIKSMGLIRKYKLCENKPIELTKIQKSVLIGSLLGDAHISLKRKNPLIKFEQCAAQKELIEWKHSIFENMAGPIVKNTRKPDKRTGNVYESYSFYLKSNPEFLPFYNSLYKGNSKDISIEFLEHYNEISLATHIMDDGSRNNNQIVLNTQSFSTKGVDILRNHLENKFGIKSHIRYNRKLPILCINSTSFDLVRSQTSNYIIESMKYKVSKLG